MFKILKIMFLQKNIFVIFSIILFDISLFYCQLLGSSSVEKYLYSGSLSYGFDHQISDISTAGGWNITAEATKNLYYSSHSPISIDIGADIFWNSTKGLNVDPLIAPTDYVVLKETGYTIFYNNYKSTMGGIGIDVITNLEKYRQEQNWYASLGLGVNWGIFTVNMDLKNSNGDYYISDFDRIKNLSTSARKDELKKILDGVYETKAEGFNKFPLRSTLMPSIELEAGYDLTSFMTLFVKDKLYLRASNKIDGEIHKDDNRDKFNYLNAGLKYNFGHKQKLYLPQNTLESVRTSRISDSAQPVHYSGGYPVVKIIEPVERELITDNKNLNIKATIENVNKSQDIYCKVNDETLNFDFKNNTVFFTASLKEGENKIQVYAKNESGQSRDVIVVTFHQKEVKEAKPFIALIDPASTKFKSPTEVFTILAKIINVSDKSQLSITANDYPLKSFTYNANTQEFKIKVKLAEGLNSFQINANNAGGTSSSAFDIYYNADIPDDNSPDGLPTINIISPENKNPDAIKNGSVDLKAIVKGVKSKNDLHVFVNNNEDFNFKFDSITNEITDKIMLSDRQTAIKITANNIFGDATNEITVLFNKPKSDETVKISFLEVTNPDSDCSTSITAKVPCATSKNEIRLYLNKNEIRNFSFNSVSHIVKSSIYLDEGQNLIKLECVGSQNSIYETYQISCGQINTDNNANSNDSNNNSSNNSNNNNNNNNNSDGNNSNGNNNSGNMSTVPVFTEKPLITFVYPQAFATIEDEEISVKARVKNIISKEDLTVEVNGDDYNQFNYDTSTAMITIPLVLNTEDYKIQIFAVNEVDTSDESLIFKYEPPLAGPPEVMINSPRNRFVTEDKTTVFRVKIDNLRNIKDVTVTLNDKVFTDYKFDKEESIIFGELPLKLGENKLKVDAKNKLGADNDEVTFFSRSEKLPAVQIIEPKEGLIAGSALSLFQAVVQNVTDKTKITLLLNGKQNTGFTLSNGIVDAKLYLQKGMNEIIIKASNAYGVAVDTTHISFGMEVLLPVITFINPSKTGLVVHDKVVNFEAKVTNIKHSSFVNLYLNSVVIEDVKYFKDEMKVTATLKLDDGINIIRLVAENATGQSDQNVKIYYEK